MFYLVRHGEADYSEKGTKIFIGFGENFAPLTPCGIEQIKKAATDKRLANADLLISSPYTRALQSAAILSKKLRANIIVEPDLHEWLADIKYEYPASKIIDLRCTEFNELNGNYPANILKPWENNEMLEARLLRVLRKYTNYEKVIVVCHGILIHSIYKDHWTEHGEIIEYRL